MKTSIKIVCFILIPIICLPIALVHRTPGFLCLYQLVVLAAFWALDVLPYGVTSLLPILLAPLMSIDTSQNISETFSSDALILCLGRLILACAFQKHQIHRRFGLFLLTKFGPQPRMIMLSCMIPCYILTMFISNTATAPIMLEFVLEVLNEYGKIEEGRELNDEAEQNFTHYGSTDISPILSQKNYGDFNSQLTMNEDYPSMTNVIEVSKIFSERKFSTSISTRSILEKKFKRFSLALSLGTGYAASSGAIATLVAAGPNLVAFGVVDKQFNGILNYGNFIAIGLPLSIITFLLTWVWVGTVNIGPREFFACRKNSSKEDIFLERIKDLLKDLGRITFAEISCIGLTGFVIIMWILRKVGTIGWGCAFQKNATAGHCGEMYVSDATPMVLVVILLYIWPTRWDFWRNDSSRDSSNDRLLTWDYTNRNLPWAIIFLLGTGLAITEICNKSQFTQSVSYELTDRLKNSSPFAIILLAATLGCVTTEFLSSTTILPILVSIFIKLEIKHQDGLNHFNYFFPLTFCSSFAFCLPAATTPNIAIFNRGLASTKEMIKTGLLMDIVFLLLVSCYTYGVVGHIIKTD
uniref:Slc13a-3 n=1 Tax=Schmidtea mediterranea TaxID=79327 RepID=A0A0H3YF83_SCHMD|nr:slc13a-3 [Schmidtea mediterranea]